MGKNSTKKKNGNCVLIFNSQNEILLVKPTYKDQWSLPGGIIENDESPREAGIREVKEEIGFDFSQLDFVCVNYMKTRPKHTESLQFIFNAGKISNDQIKKIKLNLEEISEHRFYKIKNALPLLTPTAAYRLKQSIKAIKNKNVIYLE